MTKVRLEHANDGVDTVFEVLDVAFVVFEDRRDDAFDSVRITFAKNSDQIIELGDVEDPVVVDKLIVLLK